MIDLEKFMRDELPRIKELIPKSEYSYNNSFRTSLPILGVDNLIQAFEEAMKALKGHEFRWVKMREEITEVQSKIEKYEKDLGEWEKEANKKYTHAVVHANLDPIKARHDERERCAKIAESHGGMAARVIAKEIREGK